MKRTLIALLLTAALMFAALPAVAGVVMVHKDTYADQGAGKEGVTTAYIDKDRVRVESKGGQDDTIFIFRQDKQVMWIVDTNKKMYVEVTKEQLKKSRAQIEQAKAQMKEKLKNMPEAQRKQMEQMMGESFLADEKPVPKYNKVGSEKVGKWSTEKYVGTQDGRERILYTAPLSEIGMKSSDFDVFRAYNEFISVMGPGLMDPFPTGDAGQKEVLGFEGVPVKTIEVDPDTGEKNVSTIAEVRRESLAASLFEVPAGLTKHDPEQMK